MKPYIKISALSGVGTPHMDEWTEIWKVDYVQMTFDTLRTNFDENEGPGYLMAYCERKSGDGWYLRKDFAEAFGFMEGPWSDILLTPVMED